MSKEPSTEKIFRQLRERFPVLKMPHKCKLLTMTEIARVFKEAWEDANKDANEYAAQLDKIRAFAEKNIHTPNLEKRLAMRKLLKLSKRKHGL